MYSYSYRSVDL